MSAITDVLIADTGWTAINTSGKIAPRLENASDTTITVRFGGGGATHNIPPGGGLDVPAGIQVGGSHTGSGDKTLKVLRAIRPFKPRWLSGEVVYQGTWNANTNTPALASGVGTSGYYYLVSVAGSTNLDGITDWQVGDRAIFEGTVWQKIDSTDAAHALGGALHTADTLANLNTKVSDATLVPATHTHMGGVDGAILNMLKGALDSALTGTVTVSAASAAVVGAGTAFDTELQVDDAIKIVDEIFTVQAIADATHLTLDSNHIAGAAGVTAYRDPDLYSIQTGDGSARFIVTKSGYVKIGDGFVSSHGLGAAGDIGIDGKLEVKSGFFAEDGFVLGGTFFMSSNQEIKVDSTFGAIRLRQTTQTPDAPMILTGSVSNSWIIAEHGDVGVDHGHPLQIDPTFFWQSADGGDITEWLSVAYGEIATGKGDLYFNPTGVVKFGTHTALGGESVTGYITIKDAGGATRLIAVVS